MKAVVTVDVNPKYARTALEIAGYDVREKSDEEICKMAIQMNDCYAVETEQINIGNSIDNERKEGEIELVIKIPEEEYRWIKKSDKTVFADVASKECMLHAIKNGTPLPKGHGNLKDMGNLPYIFDLTRDDPIYSGKDIERAVNSMKSIIEADTQNKEKEDFEEERDI